MTTFTSTHPSWLRATIAWLAAALLVGCGKSEPPDHNSEPRRYIYQYGQKVRFGYGGDSFRFRLGGWSHIEREFTWTDGIGASLALRVPASTGPVKLRMRMGAFTKLPELPYQPVHVYVNSRHIGSWKVAERRSYSITIPQEFVSPPENEHEGGGAGETPLGFTNAGKTRLLIVDLHLPKASSPFDLDVNWDIRRLGVQCFEAQITQSPEQASADAAGAAADAAAAAAVAATADDDAAPTLEEGEPDQPYAFGTIINFGAGAGAERYKVSGWYTAEEQFSWTGKAMGVIALNIPSTGSKLKLRARLAGMIKRGSLAAQPTEVYANGTKIAEWPVSDTSEFTATIPAEIGGKGGRLEIGFRALKAVAPKAIGAGGDVRMLGVRCESVVITPEPEQ